MGRPFSYLVGVVLVAGGVLPLMISWLSLEQQGDPPVGLHERSRESVQLPPRLATNSAYLKHTFLVSNDTAETVLVRNVVASCGCTATMLANHDLAPGATTELSMSTSLHGRSGQQQFSCRLLLDNGAVWRYDLNVDVLPSREVQPLLLNFDSLPANEPLPTRTATIRLRGEAAGGLPELTIESVPDGFSAECFHLQTEEERPGVFVARFSVRVTALPAAARVASSETKQGQILLSTGVEGESIQLPLSWSVPPDFVLEPNRVFVRSQDWSEPGQRVVIRHRFGKKFVIQRCTVKGDRLAVEWPSKEPTAEQSIILNFKTDVPNFYWNEVVIETDLPDTRAVRVPIAVFK